MPGLKVLGQHRWHIIYGGNVTPEYAANLLACPDLDGLGATRRGRNAAIFAQTVRLIARMRTLADLHVPAIWLPVIAGEAKQSPSMLGDCAVSTSKFGANSAPCNDTWSDFDTVELTLTFDVLRPTNCTTPRILPADSEYRAQCSSARR